MKLIVCTAMLSMVFSACITETAHLEYGEVVYVNEFPVEIALPKQEPFMTDIEGAVDLIDADSLILVRNMNSPFVSVYSPENQDRLSSLVVKGPGPNEIPGDPSCIQTYKCGDDVMLRFVETGSKALYNLNVTESLNRNTEVYDSVIQSDIYKHAHWVYPIARHDTLYWHNDFVNNGYKRTYHTNQGMQKITLSHNPITTELDVNMFGFVPEVNTRHMTVAEAMIRLNQITFYSLTDSSFCKTVCIGHKLDNVIEENNKFKGNQLRMYQAVQATDNAFACLYLGVKRSDFDNCHSAQLQIFTPYGAPVLRINIPFAVNTFRISKDGTLYLFSYTEESEKLYRYDVPELKKAIVEVIGNNLPERMNTKHAVDTHCMGFAGDSMKAVHGASETRGCAETPGD